MIAGNLREVRERIAAAARKAGRGADSVRLVAVSKEVTVEDILAAKAAGATLFGESKVQDARDKIVRLHGQNLTWHLIGHLQKNKVKYIFGLFELIHSVDSVELAEAIHRESRKHGGITSVLIQVNVSGEAAKFGVAPGEVEPLLTAVAAFDGIRVEGFMTIPPYDPDPERSRPHFVRLRELRDSLRRLEGGNIRLDQLSMGMSGDYTVAVEEGATLVRVGTAIFGQRAAGLSLRPR